MLHNCFFHRFFFRFWMLPFSLILVGTATFANEQRMLLVRLQRCMFFTEARITQDCIFLLYCFSTLDAFHILQCALLIYKLMLPNLFFSLLLFCHYQIMVNL